MDPYKIILYFICW